MKNLIDGKHIAHELNARTAQRVLSLKERGIVPKLVVILVGDNEASRLYVRNKKRTAEKIGIECELITLPATIEKKEIIATIEKVQKDKRLSGLIVQLPLPEPLYTTEVLNAIRPEFDVDCLTDVNLGKLVMETHSIVPPTPGAVLTILDELNIDVKGKNITIVGTGALVGKPLAIMLMNMQATVTTCNIETKDVKDKTRTADILISAVGKKDLIRGTMVKRKATVIDSGVDFENNIMFGDINFKEVAKKASYITPTPGGVGPVTVAYLLANTVTCAELLSE